MRYNNYHKHTHFSNILVPDSIVKPIDYAKRAIELGHTTIATTEHGYAGDVFQYNDIAEEYNLKLIFGIEYYYVDDRFAKDRSNSHLMILAKNDHGRKQMNKIMSEANKTGYYYRARIDKELLFQLNPRDVVVTSTCVISYINKHDDYEENFIKPLHDYFGDNFYLELHDNTHPMQVEYNKKILDLHNKYDIPFIHATDSHYIYPEQDEDRTEFLNGKNIYYPEEEGFILDYPDSDTIFKRYEEQGVFTREQVESALKNTLILDEFEDIEFSKDIKMPSIYPDLTHKEKINKLKEVIGKEWIEDSKNIPKERHNEYKEAILQEMEIIRDTMMEDYFLLNYPIIKRGKELGGVLTRTGRGSAPSFYLNKLLGFTEVDRLNAPITLYPTRFMSKSRILETKSLPDIDFNTSDPEPFIQATKEILGEDNCHWMTAYGTMQQSEAFRNLCRARDIPMSEFNDVGKDIDSYRDHPEWKDIIEESKKFIGVIDSVSPHPCANLLLSQSISEEIGIIKVGDTGEGKENEFVYCALIDSDTSDKYKYLKNDYLTVTVWKIISETFKDLNIPIPDVRELESLVEGDMEVWDLYAKGLTATLNQAGTDSGTPQAIQYKPKSVRELSGWVAAIRPSFASMKDYFLNRKPFSYGIKEFDDLLRESDNFILYQENIMAALVYCGFPEDETYGLLKAIAKKQEGIIEPIKERFINGFVAKTGSIENAEKVWRIVEDSVGYGFNSSHAYSVALDSVYGAYLKAKYPLTYYSVVLRIYQNKTEMTAKIMKELDHFNIKVLPIRYGKSSGDYIPNEETNSIYKGIGSIKFLNSQVGEDLLKLSKQKKFNCFADLIYEIHQNSIANFQQIKILAQLNFFEEFGGNEKLLKIIDKYESRLKNKKLIDSTKEKRITEVREYEESLPDSKFNIKDQIRAEVEFYGYEVTTNPKLPNNVYIVTDINTKYAPRLRLYHLKDGSMLNIKCYKRDLKKNEFGLYNVIRVKKIVEQKRKRKVDNEWVELDETEQILKEWDVLR